MNETKTTTKNEVTSKIGVSIDQIKQAPKASKPVVMDRNIHCVTIADDITSRVTGKLIGFDDLFDPKTKTFKTEDELSAKGAFFVTIHLDKILIPGGSDVNKKSRLTKIPTPYIRKISKYQVISNVNWGSFVNKRGHGDFVPVDFVPNGHENYNGCNAIGNNEKLGTFTVKGVAFKILESTRYLDENGKEYTDIKGLKNEYFKTSWDKEQENRQKEADKHGIDVRFDPQYRTTRIDNCKSIRAFGFNYKPTENHCNS